METFNFKFDSGEYIVIESPLTAAVHVQDPATFQWVWKNKIVPPTAILRIDNITMGGQYKRASVEVVFSFLVRKNKHIKEAGIPKKFNVSVYDLNGLAYRVLKESEVETEMNVLLRKMKIENLEYNGLSD